MVDGFDTSPEVGTPNPASPAPAGGNAAECPEHESPFRFWVGVLSFVGVVITFIDRVNLSVAAPDILRQFHLSRVVMGVALSAFFWTYTVMQIPSGMMVDRVGLKKTFGWMYSSWGLVTAATALVRSAPGLSFVRALLGFVEAPIYPGLVPVLRRWFREGERALAMGAIGSGLAIGLSLGSVLAGALITAFGWQTMFVATGIISLLIGVLWLVTYRELSPRFREQGTGTRVGWGRLLRERNVWGLTLGYFGNNYSLYFFLTWLPSFFVSHFHFTILRASFFTGLVFVTGILGKPFAGWLSGFFLRRGFTLTFSRKIIMVPACILGMTVAVAAFTHNPYLAAALIGVGETFSTTAGIVCWATGADIAPPDHAGSVGGIMNTAAGLGGVVAPILTGILLTATHTFIWPMVVAGLVLALSAVSYGLLVGEIKPMLAAGAEG